MPWWKKKEPPPESASLPRQLLDDSGQVAFSPEGEVEVLSDLAGTFAVANAKHQPLPPAGDPRAVFVPNFTRGIVKGVGPRTVMVDFGPPLGLLHIRRVDLRNPVLPELRRRWADGPVRIDAAGLIDVLARAEALAAPAAQALAAAVSLSQWERLRSPDLAESIARTVKVPAEQVGSLGLATERADDIVSLVRVVMLPLVHSSLASFSPGDRRIRVNLGSILLEARRDLSQPSVEGFQRILREFIAHELRHAADWAYEVAHQEPGMGTYSKGRLPDKERAEVSEDLRRRFKIPGPSGGDPKRQYVNRPTELKSFAGQVAGRVWDRFGPDWRGISGDRLLDFIRFEDRWTAGIWLQLAPENTRTFLQRVVKGLEQLEATRAAGMKNWFGGAALGLAVGVAVPTATPGPYQRYIKPAVEQVLQPPSAPGATKLGPGQTYNPDTGEVVQNPIEKSKPVYVPRPKE